MKAESHFTGQVSTVVAAVVPEPSRALLLLEGGVVLLVRRRPGAGFTNHQVREVTTSIDIFSESVVEV